MDFAHSDYTLVSKLGVGATSTVYLAVQNKLNRRVALKVLHGGVGQDRKFRDRFLREGRIVARLNHPHIVPVFDVGEQDSTCFMAMEYLAGGTLKTRTERLTIKDLFMTIGQVADALAYAHEQGFVHRDVKPDNILFRSSEHVTLADFGIARATESLTHMTVTGAIMGTPAYMSPEQVGGTDLDGRADLYSLGIVLYELLTGHTPFDGDSMMSIGLQHITTPVPPLPTGSKAFQPIIDLLLAKRPAERCRNAGELLDALASLESKSDIDPGAPLTKLHGDKTPAKVSLAATLSLNQSIRRRIWPWIGIAVLAGSAIAMVWLPEFIDPPSEQSPQGIVDTANTPGPVIEVSETDRKLAAARAAMTRGDWFSPDEDSAINLFDQVLLEDPDNPIALDGKHDVLQSALETTRSAIARGTYDEARSFIENISRLWPMDEDLKKLQVQLEQAETREAAELAAIERTQRLNDLLSQAESATRAGRWIEPAGDNAHFYYTRALEVDEENISAILGVQTVAKTLVNRAADARQGNNFDAADVWLKRAAGIAPSLPDLPGARLSLANARQAHADAAQTAAAQLLLESRISDLVTRVGAWIGDEQESLEGRGELEDEIKTLLREAPSHPEMRRLQTALAARVSEIQDKKTSDRFRTPTF